MCQSSCHDNINTDIRYKQILIYTAAEVKCVHVYIAYLCALMNH